jgi:hypothetical protein
VKIFFFICVFSSVFPRIQTLSLSLSRSAANNNSKRAFRHRRNPQNRARASPQSQARCKSDREIGDGSRQTGGAGKVTIFKNEYLAIAGRLGEKLSLLFLGTKRARRKEAKVGTGQTNEYLSIFVCDSLTSLEEWEIILAGNWVGWAL